ncbi:hypothetical protein BOTBODRAFT_37455 [Botryobasidium botryosum FD-172 SS1]|uniref:Pirin N-terminal domain-containing protein n=1 Tax=Botryobasidium botryosum (strain FD-172 SS1) TaxID=930990 RepID=A0A067M2K1_BOTB1|nr:hypothetical protein BOTBODRAFT_37455 [Botryobasidium botryosum FD-172 SS1]
MPAPTISSALSPASSSSSLSSKSNASDIKIIPRLSQNRGHADHGWLKTFHSFSFADYYDPQFRNFGFLKVLNEDRVAPSEGFGQHAHREREIFSYIVSGELEHKDSLGNFEVLRRGDVQLTSAGTGIFHSEYNPSTLKPVHFLSIWAMPSVRGVAPAYYTRHFTDDEKRDKLVRVVAPATAQGVSTKPQDTGPAPVQSGVTLHASLLSSSHKVTHTLHPSALPSPASTPQSSRSSQSPPTTPSTPAVTAMPVISTVATTPPADSTRKSYVHVIQASGYNTGPALGGKIRLNDEVTIAEGDGAFVYGESGAQLEIENVGVATVEILVFDIE